MDVKKIEELIRVLEGSPSEELSVQKGDYRVYIKKGRKPAAVPVRKTQTTGAQVNVQQTQPTEHFVNAPMVGIFHVVDGIARVGATIIEGQVVGSIESMKLANDVTSNIAGTVLEVLVEDGMPIEYGQPLFKVEPAK